MDRDGEERFQEDLKRVVKALEVIAHQLVILNRHLVPKDYPAPTGVKVTVTS